MRLFRYTVLPVFLVAALVVATGCQDLSIENKNEPDRERALANPSDLVSLLEGGHSTVFQEINGLWGVHMSGLADQMTSTNAYLSFWDFTEQPRLRIDNTQTYANPAIINGPWSDFNSGVSSANSILTTIEKDGKQIVVDGNDRTQEIRAAAYMLRGIARGYIGMIYDKGYIVGLDTDPTQLETSSYSEVISAAVQDLEQAKSIAQQASGGFSWNLLPSSDSWNAAQFQEIANSFAARFMINEARTMDEASQWPDSRWNTILNYAENGVGQGASMPSFVATGVGSYVFYHNHADWQQFVLSDGSGYNPPDIKLAHLLDPSYPADYPTESGVVLDPAESEDPRIEYMSYVGSNFGFLDPSRNRALFTSYAPFRMYGGNNWGRSGLPMPFITGSEMQYIIAEANLWLGNKVAAAQALENSPFGDVPTDLGPLNLPVEQDGLADYGAAEGLAAGKEISASASRAEFVRALHTEYSVELQLLGGEGIQWYFMRRHDLLQAGTPLHYPIPGQELQVTQRDYYTFGGANNTGEAGTATGANSWKTFDENLNLKRVVGAEQDAKEYQSTKRILSPPQNFSGGKRYKGHE